MDNAINLACAQIIHENKRISKTALKSLTTDQDVIDKIELYGSVRFAWHIVHDTWTIPNCTVCSKPTKWLDARRRYGLTCSKSCSNIDPCRTQKREQTLLEKYGVTNASQSEEIKAKKRATTLKNHGVEYPAQSKEIRAKQQATTIKSHGVAFAMQSEKLREKQQNTMIDQYGVANAAHSQSLQDKKKETCLEKYGTEYAYGSNQVRDKIAESMMAKWGVENPSQHPDIQQKKIKTSLEKYGVEYPSQNSQIKQKQIDTWIEKYGAIGTYNNDELNAKAKQTMIEKYGVEYPLQNSKILQKTHETNCERYGYPVPSMSSQIQEKTKQTNLARYGSESYRSSEIGKQKLREILQEKYGVENIMHLPETVDKIKSTTLQRYGVTSINHLDKTEKTIQFLTDIDFFKQSIQGKTVPDIAEEFELSESSVYILIKKRDCKDLIIATENSYEKKVKDLLNHYSIKYVEHNREIIKPYELDIYLPEYNLAVEVGSVHWHSERYRSDKNYHYNKWHACKKQNITLLQFFDEDMLDAWHLTSSKILRTIGVSKIPIVGARKIEIFYPTYADEVTFFNQWHAKGFSTNRNWSIGARYNNQTVGILTVKRTKTPNVVKIERWATDINFSFPGLFSRLLSHWIKKVNFKGTIETWCDNRLGDGKVYRSCGFTECESSDPGYWYFKNKGLENRVKYQRHKLQKIFNLSEEENRKELTEYDIMLKQGYDRLWDAGHTKWIKEIK